MDDFGISVLGTPEQETAEVIYLIHDDGCMPSVCFQVRQDGYFASQAQFALSEAIRNSLNIYGLVASVSTSDYAKSLGTAKMGTFGNAEERAHYIHCLTTTIEQWAWEHGYTPRFVKRSEYENAKDAGFYNTSVLLQNPVHEREIGGP